MDYRHKHVLGLDPSGQFNCTTPNRLFNHAWSFRANVTLLLPLLHISVHCVIFGGNLSSGFNYDPHKMDSCYC